MDQATGTEEKPTLPGRRDFLRWVFAASLTMLGSAAGVVAGGFLYPVKKQKSPGSFVCLESEIPEDAPKEIADPAGRKVLLMRQANGELMAIGTICSHLGCAVYYRPAKSLFECPCHNGVFDAQGNPVSGPPRRSLDRYPTEIREGKVFVRFA